MITHDQKEVKTELTETEVEVSEETTSKQETETKTEETTLVSENAVEEPQAEIVEEPVPEPETPVEEAQIQEPVSTPEPEPVPEPEELLSTEQAEPVAEPVPEEDAASMKIVQEPALSPEEQNHNDMLSMYEQSFTNFQSNQIVEGMVVEITDKAVLVDIGYKSEGEIPIQEFSYSGIPEKNSMINVYINAIESGDGKLVLSKRKADFILNISKIKSCFEDGSTLTGSIRRRVKGGMIVDVLGIEAFLPGSQMSIKPIPNLDQFIGKELTFKVVNIDEEHRNIILSRKQVLEDEAVEKRNELLQKIEIGSELDGEVKNITQYGAFIDLGGIDGLLHLTDMSWGKINHPSEMLNIGDKVKVKVINFDPETNKISLGLKQLVPHPWENVEIKFPEGTSIKGKVMSVKSFGAFVEIEPGVEGLVHISEMSWTKKITDARKILKTDDTVSAIVLELDKENRRISLGMKQMEPNPWLSIEDHYPIGTVITRKVKSLTAFGAFVEIEEGIDGLIHISDISWTKRIYHPREVFRKNQEVEAIVLSIDRALHRIALGVKQLHIDPWQELDRKLPVNTEVIGKVSKLIPKGVLVDVTVGEDVVEGFVPISHLAIPKLERSEDAFFVGEDVPLKVIELDMENRRLILSVRAFFFSREPRLQEEFIALHENFMRERIVKMNKKKQEKESREKALKEKIKQETEERLAQEKADLDKAFSTDGQVPEPTAEEPAVELAPLEVEQPAEEPAVEPVPLEAEQPAEEPAVEPAPLEAEQPAEEPTVEPAPLEVEQPAEEPTVEPAPLEVEQPAEEPTVEPAPLEAEQPAEEPVEEIQAVIPAVVEEPVVPETIPEEEVPAAETLQDNEPKQ